ARRKSQPPNPKLNIQRSPQLLPLARSQATYLQVPPLLKTNHRKLLLFFSQQARLSPTPRPPISENRLNWSLSQIRQRNQQPPLKLQSTRARARRQPRQRLSPSRLRFLLRKRLIFLSASRWSLRRARRTLHRKKSLKLVPRW